MTTPFRVLLVEDDPADAFLVTRAFDELDAPMRLECKDRADAALDLAERSTFDLIVTDLKLPGMDGHDLVAALRDAPVDRLTPVVVLSSSGDPHDVSKAYRNGANAYVRKPRDLEGYEALASDLVGFWRGHNVAPA